nr:hypothetical protein [Agrobacterium fabrum]
MPRRRFPRRWWALGRVPFPVIHLPIVRGLGSANLIPMAVTRDIARAVPV